MNIKNETMFILFEDLNMIEKSQPACEGPTDKRCGHNVTDNDEFIKKSEKK